MLIFSTIFNVNVLKTYYFKKKLTIFLKNLLFYWRTYYFTLQCPPTNSNYFRQIYLLFSVTLHIRVILENQI